MHGIDIDKIAEEKHEEATQHFLFDDPKNYEKLSDEEKEIRTKEMMRYHKGLIKRTTLKGG